MPTYFTPRTFTFLRALARNNNREWFNAHKGDFEQHVRAPYQQFVADLAEPLKKISPHFIADPKPVGGSMFRIYRDTRFSKDKTPYKTWAGSQFFHARKRELQGEAPVFYLHIAPKECFVGGGLWHPQPETLRRVRAYMVANPASWKKATRGAPFRKDFELGGDALTRPPAGFDPQHELVEDLKRKDFVASAEFDDAVACSDSFMKLVLGRFRQIAPMVDWLCGALDLEF
jgi:uncharacterized protein (TIGR02453 family)